MQRTRIATLYGSGPARSLATPLSGHKAQTLSGITSATHTWEAAPVLVRYGRWTRLINVSLMAFNSSAVRDGSSPHPEAVWVPCLSDRRTLSPDVMIFRATTDSTERHMHGTATPPRTSRDRQVTYVYEYSTYTAVCNLWCTAYLSVSMAVAASCITCY